VERFLTLHHVVDTTSEALMVALFGILDKYNYLKDLSMSSTNSRMHKQRIGGGRQRRTLPKPPDRRS
jgi:hypothetical protein